jgi:hypothetical protein
MALFVIHTYIRESTLKLLIKSGQILKHWKGENENLNCTNNLKMDWCCKEWIATEVFIGKEKGTFLSNWPLGLQKRQPGFLFEFNFFSVHISNYILKKYRTFTLKQVTLVMNGNSTSQRGFSFETYLPTYLDVHWGFFFLPIFYL